MSKLYLSDLHLGSQFFESQDTVVGLIKSSEFDEINLVGDIWDVWDKSFGEIYAKHHVFFTALSSVCRTKRVRFTRGNHDPEISEIKAYLPEMEYHTVPIRNNEEGIICLHGDEFSDSILKHDWISRLLYTFIILPLHKTFRINLRDRFKDLLGSVAHHKNKSYYQDICLDIEKAAIEKYKDEYKHIVLGHTHLPKLVIHEHNNQRVEYINCGDWIHNKTWVVSKNGQFELFGDKAND